MRKQINHDDRWTPLTPPPALAMLNGEQLRDELKVFGSPITNDEAAFLDTLEGGFQPGVIDDAYRLVNLVERYRRAMSEDAYG